MTDPRRLLEDDSAYPFSRGLLASAADDGLDRDRLAEIVRAATRAPADTSSEPAAPATSSKGRLLTRAIPLATLSLIAAGAFVLTQVEEHAPPVQAPSAHVPERNADAIVAPATEVIPVAQLPSVANHDEPPPSTPATIPQKTAAPPGASADPDRLMEEVRALERVSSAIAQHRIADARANLTAYERTFPKQLLASEARFLEIEILDAEEQHEKARARASAYLASWPDSPYASRVRSIATHSRP